MGAGAAHPADGLARGQWASRTVTVGHEEVCEVGKAMVEEVTGAPVTECCERGAHPRCAFAIAS